jgi:hypothetical protein
MYANHLQIEKLREFGLYDRHRIFAVSELDYARGRPFDLLRGMLTARRDCSMREVV